MRAAAQVPGDRTTENGHHGTLHLPGHAPGHCCQLPVTGDLRGGPILQWKELLQGHRLVSVGHRLVTGELVIPVL